MSTQEQAVPKRRSSRGATANRRTTGPRTPASAIAEASATTSVSADAAIAAPAVDKKATVKGAKAPAEVGSRKERGQKGAPASRKVIATERFDGIRRFTRETVAEIKKVNWPDQQTTRNLTAVVIAVSAVLGILLGGIDFILLKIFEALP